MSEAKVILGAGIAFTVIYGVLSWAMNTEFLEAETAPLARYRTVDEPAYVTEPAFTGKRSQESKYTELRERWQEIREGEER
jgi:hypothetical protein